jgi:ADP-ribose pyrophosphatase
MSEHNRAGDPRVLHEGRFLRFVDRGGWEYVQRIGVAGIVVVVAVTDRGELVLVEQYRPAVDARVLDMPAGLAGDRPGEADEDLAEAARRELLEETGFEADSLEFLTEGPASSGSSAEILTLLMARNVRQVAAGGGDEHEEIQVHVVPLDGAAAWLDERRKEGVLVDPKVYAGLYFLEHLPHPEP